MQATALKRAVIAAAAAAAAFAIPGLYTEYTSPRTSLCRPPWRALNHSPM